MAVDDHITTTTKGSEALVEGGAPDGIVDDMDTFTVGDAVGAGGKIFVTVEDGVICAETADKFSFYGSRYGGDDDGTTAFGELNQQRTDPTSGGVDKDGITGADEVGVVGEAVSGHSLKEAGSGGDRVDRIGEGDKLILRDGGELGVVAAHVTRIGDPISDFEGGDRSADLFDDASGFDAGDEGELDGIVTPLTVLDIDVIDTDGLIAHEHAIRRKRRQG